MDFASVFTRELFERVIERRKQAKPPSQRNQQIAEQVRLHGRRQVDVAAEYGLSQRRVSQICQQIEHWQGDTWAWERGDVGGDARRRVDLNLQRQQLTEVYRRSMRAFTRSEQPLVARRRGKRAGGGKWSEQCEREQKLDTASLRVALRAIEMHGKLNERIEPGDENADQEHMKFLEWVLATLVHMRRGAEKRGEVPRSPAGPQALVERMVRELLGDATAEPPLAGTKPGPGDVLEDVAPQVTGSRFASGYCKGVEPEDGEGRETQPAATNHHWQDANAAPSRSSSLSDVEERVEGPVEAPVEALPATPAAAASLAADTSCDEPSNGEVAIEGPQKSINRSAPDESQSTAAKLAELKRQAWAQLEYQFRSAMSDEQIAEELKFLRHWEAGCYSMTEHSRGQRAALYEWERLNADDRAPVAKVARRRVPTTGDPSPTLMAYGGQGR
jgi:hypothetical protein